MMHLQKIENYLQLVTVVGNINRWFYNYLKCLHITEGFNTFSLFV